VIDYVRAQVEAGVEAVQIFDSWVGCLGPDDYREYVLPHMRTTLAAVATTGVPVIHFGTGTAALLELMREAGGDVIGFDWRVDLADAWRRVGGDVGVQGNLDPAALLAPPAEIRRRVAAVLERAGGRPGHVFNLGHGVLPETPPAHVAAMIDAVHELSAR
jgi:uroporphyrinogen decarboxylase